MSDVTITVAENGSYKVEGPARLLDSDGNPIETREGKPFYLCRCGHSSNKPFCDGTHNRIQWDGSLADRS
jgi:CDGSH-type Zn-finger protein